MKTLDAIEAVLRDEGQPLHYARIADLAGQRGYKTFGGPTPWATVASSLSVDISSNGAGSRFVKIARGVYGLRAASAAVTSTLTPSKPAAAAPKAAPRPNARQLRQDWSEADLHPLLTHFVQRQWKAATKTISQAAHKKGEQGSKKWLHPDLVSVDVHAFLDPHARDLRKTLGLPECVTVIRSFELKRSLDNVAVLTEFFFEAVSNSSWAHEGYLAAAIIPEGDAEIMGKLHRLCAAHQVGLIKLDIEDPDRSRILIPSATRDDLDWATVEALLENNDFRKFSQSVVRSVAAQKLQEDEFDGVLERDSIVRSFRGTGR